MSLTILGPESALHPNDSDPLLSDFRFKILAQGDSWFSIGANPPWSTSNILQQFHFTQRVAIINCAYPGITLANEVRRSMYFNALLTGNFSTKWDAILISGGGNDLIDALLGDKPLLRPDVIANGPDVSQYVDQQRLARFKEDIAQSMAELEAQKASGQNKDVPVFFNTYDYPTARNAPAGPNIGPWLWKALGKAKVPDAAWPGLTSYLFDVLNTCLENGAARMRNAHLVKTHDVLTRAKDAAPGESGDWENEIHPTAAGYRKLAQKWADSLSAIGID